MHGALVTEPVGSRHAELDVLHPVSGAAQQPRQRPDLPRIVCFALAFLHAGRLLVLGWCLTIASDFTWR
jgi:hypothetical protein